MRMRSLVLSVLFLPLCFCLAFSSTFLALNASAVDPVNDYIELSQIVMDDILSDCTWYYENTNGGYSVMSSPFIFHTTGYDLSLDGYTSTWWYDTGQNVRDLYVCYWDGLPADIAEDSGFQFSLLCNFGVYFSNITHLDISASCYPSYDRRAVPASSYSSHFYAQIGENDSQFLHMTSNFGGGSPDSQNFSISNYIMNGNINHPPLYNGYSGCAVYNFDRQNPSNCQLGDFLLCNIGRARFSSDTPYVYYVVFSGIRVNTGYLYHGHDSPSPPVTTTGPVIDSASGSASGVIGEGTNTTPVNININIENDNTSLVGRILSGIASIFIPDDDFMEGFSEDLQDEFSEHLGGVSEAVELLDEQADYFRNAVAVNTVYFPGLEIELEGQDYTIIQSQDVELRPANTSFGLKELWDAVAFAVDVVAVLSVLNMLQTKYEIFLNPDGEVIDYDS